VQIVAMITMLIDHIGAAFYPDQWGWRIIGRLSFPIYAYCIVIGYRHTKNMKQYMKRLFLIAIVSQYPYMIVFNTWGLNVVGTLLLSLIVLVGLERYKKPIQILMIVGATSVVLEALDFSYGMYGLLLVLAYRYTKEHIVMTIHFVLNVIFMYVKGWLLGMLNVVSTILIVYYPVFYAYMDTIKVPRWLWRSFYPAHLTIIGVILLVQQMG
jgi:hypothetical protein